MELSLDVSEVQLLVNFTQMGSIGTIASCYIVWLGGVALSEPGP
jgi:hypothetical protein